MDELPNTINFQNHDSSFMPKVLDLTPQEKTSHHWGALALGLAFLIIFASLSFGAGWLGSVVKTNALPANEEIKGVATGNISKASDWLTYEDKINKYSINYPKDWKTNVHESTDGSGVKISKETDSVELWLRFDKVVALSAEQKAGLKTTDSSTLEINGQPAILTTYSYKAGNFFNVVVLPATETRPQVTFWILASDSSAKDTATKIVNSFKFN